MAERKSFLLRIDPDVLAAVERLAAEELRSVNGQLEYLLRRALREIGRAPRSAGGTPRKDMPLPRRGGS